MSVKSSICAYVALVAAIVAVAVLSSLLYGCTSRKTHDSIYPIDPVPFTEVKVNDAFWSPRLEASRDVTIPLAFSKCEETGRYDNFVRATKPDSTYVVGGFSFDDTDVYKTIEGASYLLKAYPDKELEAYIDSVLVLVAAAQEPDGYLNTARQMNPWHPHPWMGPERWTSVEDLSHEFYNLGHMIEGAIAHYEATGKRNFLDIAIAYADCVYENIGDGPGQLSLVPGHQIAEMALAKLYRTTGNPKYLEQAKYFLDKRGRTEVRSEYSQSHLPVTEQTTAVGHAVRAEYMYSGMADVAAMTGDSTYVAAVDRIWEDIVSSKLYITGGVGSRHEGEAFGEAYELPNASAYCETCASIGNVFTNHRMFLLHGDSKYYDVLERTLYNALLAGVSLDGGRFFYPNPLESDGSHERQPWFGCACCPSNICRFIPSVPGYVYASEGKNLYVNLYMSNSLTHRLNGQEFSLSMQTYYPLDGGVKITIGENHAGKFTIKLRIPGWARGEVVPSDLYSFVDMEGYQPGVNGTDGYKIVATEYGLLGAARTDHSLAKEAENGTVETESADFSVMLNGEPVSGKIENGYFCINRRWKEGDELQIFFSMEPRFVKAHPAVEADRGKMAVEMGPLVYCAEWPDNQGDVREAKLSLSAPVGIEYMPELLGGVNMISVGDVQMIPYYAWNHRGAGTMAVWLDESE